MAGVVWGGEPHTHGAEGQQQWGFSGQQSCQDRRKQGRQRGGAGRLLQRGKPPLRGDGGKRGPEQPEELPGSEGLSASPLTQGVRPATV